MPSSRGDSRPLPEGIHDPDALLRLAEAGGERFPGRYCVVELVSPKPQRCKGLLEAVRRARRAVQPYAGDDGAAPFDVSFGDAYLDDPYFADLMARHPDARFVIGWSPLAPLQEVAVAVLALPGAVGQRDVGEASRRLLEACAAGDRAAARKALSAGADPAAADKAGFSALHHAVAARSVPLVKLLLEAGASPDEPRSAFFVQARRGRPTHAATKIESPTHEKILLMILDAGADPSARSTAGHTVVDLALRAGRKIDPFLARGAVPSVALSDSPFLEAVAALHASYREPRGALAQIRALVQCGVSPDETGRYGNPLHALFERGYDRDETDFRVLAAIVDELLAHGVDEGQVHEGRTPGDCALAWDYPAIHARFTRFTARGAAAAAANGNHRALQRLAALGVPLDEPDPGHSDYTPLHRAIELGHAKAARLLLDHGADPDRKTRGWRSPKRPPASARELAAKSPREAIRALFAAESR